jgi:hypothetical protein
MYEVAKQYGMKEFEESTSLNSVEVEAWANAFIQRVEATCPISPAFRPGSALSGLRANENVQASRHQVFQNQLDPENALYLHGVAGQSRLILEV